MYEEVQTNRLYLNETMRADLLSSAKWAKFMAIVASIGAAFLFILGIAMLAFGSYFALPGGESNDIAPAAGKLVIIAAISYIVCALIMVYPIVKGFQFANGAKAACLTGSEDELARSFSGLRAYLKFSGIIVIIGLVIYALVLFVTGIGLFLS